MTLWTSGSTFDPALLDIIDWRLGAGQGRLVMMALCSSDVNAHGNHRALEALHDCYETSNLRKHRISLEIAPGMVWDGADLTLPGVWPETFETGLAGQPLGRLVDHPGLPRDRPITGVTVRNDDVVVHTARPAPVGLADLRARTRIGRLRDRLAIHVAAARFTRALGLHEGLSNLTVLSMVLAGMLAACAAAVGGLLVPLLHHYGLPLVPLVAAWAILSVVGGAASVLAAGVSTYHDLRIGEYRTILDRTQDHFGRSLL
jgi:hypothetical protein